LCLLPDPSKHHQGWILNTCEMKPKERGRAQPCLQQASSHACPQQAGREAIGRLLPDPSPAEPQLGSQLLSPSAPSELAHTALQSPPRTFPKDTINEEKLQGSWSGNAALELHAQGSVFPPHSRRREHIWPGQRHGAVASSRSACICLPW